MSIGPCVVLECVIISAKTKTFRMTAKCVLDIYLYLADILFSLSIALGDGESLPHGITQNALTPSMAWRRTADYKKIGNSDSLCVCVRPVMLMGLEFDNAIIVLRIWLRRYLMNNYNNHNF